NGTVTDESRNGWSVKRASDMSGDFGTINTFHVLVRGDTVIMLMSGLSYEGSARWADVITQVDSKLSMARLPGMRKAAERLGTDRDGFVYVNIAALTGEYLVGFEDVRPV